MSRLARILRRLLRIIGTTLKVTVVVTCLLTLITQEDLFAWGSRDLSTVDTRDRPCPRSEHRRHLRHQGTTPAGTLIAEGITLAGIAGVFFYSAASPHLTVWGLRRA